MPAFAAWFIGVTVALAAGNGSFSLTGTAAIDSLLAASVIFWAIELFLQKTAK